LFLTFQECVEMVMPQTTSKNSDKRHWNQRK